MNALFSEADTALLNLVSFKWLMAGRGWWVNMTRLQREPGYLRECALRGLDSGHPLLEERSALLLAALQQQACEESFALSNDVRI